MMKKFLFVLMVLAAAVILMIDTDTPTVEVSPSFYKVTGHPVEDTAHVISLN